MEFIDIDDMLGMILSADKQTTEFLAYAGIQLEEILLNMEPSPLENKDTTSVRIHTNFNKDLSLFSSLQIFEIYKISPSTIKSLKYSNPKDIGTTMEKSQRIPLISINHFKSAEDWLNKKPCFKINYYLRKNMNDKYFIETRMISVGKTKKEQKTQTQYEIPLYNRVNDKYQCLLEKNFSNFGY